MHRDLADQRDVFFFYLAVVSDANLMCKVKNSLTADVLWGSFVTHSFLPGPRQTNPKGRLRGG